MKMCLDATRSFDGDRKTWRSIAHYFVKSADHVFEGALHNVSMVGGEAHGIAVLGGGVNDEAGKHMLGDQVSAC